MALPCTIDYIALEGALVDKFKNIAFHAIVNTTFQNSVAYEATGLSKDLQKELSRFSKNMMDKLGGYKILESALLQVSDPMQAMLLVNIDTCCNQIATEAAKRVVKDAIENEDDSARTENIKEIVDNATFSMDEYKKFSNNVKSHINPEKIGEMIKEKTIQAIKDEKDAYEKAKEIDDEITNIVKPQVEDNTEKLDPSPENEGETEHDDAESGKVDGESSPELDEEEDESSEDDENPDDEEVKDKKKKDPLEEAKESFLNLYGVNYTDAKEHISFYSKLHSMVYESALVASTKKVDGIMIDSLNDAALESASILYNIPEPSITDKIQSVSRLYQSNERDQEALESVMEDSMVTSAVLYSFYETFNSLNLMTPAKESMVDLVNKSHSVNANLLSYKNDIDTVISNMTDDISTRINGIKEESVLESVIHDYKELVKITGEVTPALESIGTQLDAVKKKLSGNPDYDKYALESATIQFDRLNRMVNNRDDISKVVICGDNYTNLYPVKCYNALGKITYESTLSLSEPLNRKTAPNYMKTCIKSSGMKDCKKDIFLQDTFGFKSKMDKLN